MRKPSHRHFLKDMLTHKNYTVNRVGERVARAQLINQQILSIHSFERKKRPQSRRDVVFPFTDWFESYDLESF